MRTVNLRLSPLPVLISRHLVIGQFNLGFIIGKLDNDLFIVDQCLLMDLPKTPLVDGGSSTSTCVPRGVQDGVPKIGMSFESVKDAEARSSQVALRVSKSKDEKWVVVKFIEEHSHILATPRKVPFLPSHREVTSAQKSLISMFREADISTSQIMSFLETQSGGYQNIGSTSRDIRNVERDIRMEKKDYDAELLIEHFKESQKINPSFFYRYEVDDNHKLTRCF
ncbi:hypothetical protein H6P81_002583 [Aristolochia fimbriata]|uniref:Uncharacterized protein n=1 Tax=Aristolochia fimbriata TaxID=158543 RepID=A0AAV7FA63_ARIFI|nr:hypothetical protein H6P81_002583 [Aristolochia fimbriata]